MAVYSEEYKGYNIEIDNDDDITSPRIDCDNLGTMVCFHRNYNLGDKGHDYRSGNYNSWDELQSAIVKDHTPAVILPLYLYDHSGITMNTTGFHCPWDSGQVGFIYVSKAKVREEYSTKRITKKILETVIKVLVSEVETYDQYLRGEIYSYVIEDSDEEVIDSCCGFYGDYEEHCLPEAKNSVDYLIEQAKKEAKEEAEKNQMQLALSA